MSEVVLQWVLDATSDIFARTVSRSDSFFSLGGDSITAVELATRLEEVLGWEVDPQLVVDLPSLGALATALQSARP
jgi:acyl carrier protein